MTGAEYARKHFNGGETWLKISSKSYNAGHWDGYQQARKELDNGKALLALEKELEELRTYYKQHEHMFETGEGLAEYIGGL